ncbi:hypothetical protein FE374_07190 [Georgenia yuyongxinii]|uniref:DUF5343 domain-containing protein n=1 Tax=Georgenia yuyongxinii TaxID=2589797 RepID=A0A5B8C2S0_9MICO|nr:hypothetical protein [Georgenia yuyongxinii]QDC24437.1 hypothetical protein FE374_07190 [Georgenia yuyongxinii]
MATSNAYPKVPAKAWKVLRARASAAPSTKFTPATVAALLDMSGPRSAQDNVVSPLKKLGLLEEDGTLTERGNKWRIDSTYADACQEILDEVYPGDLAALTTPAGEPDKARIATWLQHKGFGGSNAASMAATYALIADKSPTEPPTGGDSKKNGPRKASRKAPITGDGSPKQPHASMVDVPDATGPVPPAGQGTQPVVHLDIQIHIPATADGEQIDQIFASMAKHLYQR